MKIYIFTLCVYRVERSLMTFILAQEQILDNMLKINVITEISHQIFFIYLHKTLQWGFKMKPYKNQMRTSIGDMQDYVR